MTIITTIMAIRIMEIRINGIRIPAKEARMVTY